MPENNIEKAAALLESAGQSDLAELLQVSDEQKEPANEEPDLSISDNLMEVLGVQAHEEGEEDPPDPNSAEGRFRELTQTNTRLMEQNAQMLALLGKKPDGRRAEDPNAKPVESFDFSKLTPPVVDGQRMSEADFSDEMKVLGPVIQQIAAKQKEQYDRQLQEALTPLQKQVDLVASVTGDSVMKKMVGKDWDNPDIQRVIKTLYADLNEHGLGSERGAAVLYAAAKMIVTGKKPARGPSREQAKRRGMIEGGSTAPTPEKATNLRGKLEGASDAEVLSLVEKLGQ